MWLFLALVTLLFAAPVRAQDATLAATASATATPSPTTIPTPTNNPNEDLYQKYKTDYLFLRDAYQKDYLTYIDKSRVYTKYGTVTTQKDKFDAAKTAITSRNKMLKAYLVAIRTRLAVFQDASPTETETTKIELSKWESWLDEQTQIINSIGNEKDLDQWANDFKTQYVGIETTIYTALVRQEVNSKQEALNQVQSMVSDIQALPSYQSGDQSWINNLAIKTDLVKQSLNDSIKLTLADQYGDTFTNFYPHAQQNFAQAGSYLDEIVNDLKSVITKFSQ